MFQEFGLAWGFKKELQKLESTLSTIQAVIHDAEEKQTKSEAVLNWLRKLRDVAYDADDVLDEIATEALQNRPEISGGAVKQVSNFFSRRNPLLFRFKMAHKIQIVVERLDEIAGEKAKFHFREGVMDVENNSDAERRHTSSFVIEPDVYGRDEDKEEIVRLLVDNVNNENDVSIYAIFGMGGLGKTTLVQVVYNDERVKQHFELNAWVCVSEEFDIKRLTRAIIESFERKATDLVELDPLQCRLRDILEGKRFLLVLDDVWNDNQEEWDKLKSALRFGAVGCSIIVTTRIEKIARMMATLPLHQLNVLSEEDSWTLFKRHTFGLVEMEHDPNLVVIGKDIVRKCEGIPLAIKALGGLLRFKDKESDWIAIKESEMWDLPNSSNGIFPSLRLSYNHLPSHMKQCFASCCIFPKDYWMDKEYVIQLWMANGFIPCRGEMDLEELGNEIFDELLWRSFFQEHMEDKHGNLTRCRMHDLMHDLAMSIMRTECCFVGKGHTPKVAGGVHSIRYMASDLELISWSKDIKDTQSLRTFSMLGNFYAAYIYDVSSDALKRNALRMLDFRGVDKWSIPISRLGHLRYLDLSQSSIKLLPESFTCLQNLLTLKLEFCRNLCKLPKKMRHMINLRHLSMRGSYSLTQMPRKMGLLTNLRVLDKFIVGKDSGQQIEELKDLKRLSGGIQITGLENVRNPTDAKKVNLVSKTKLDTLRLEWRDNQSDVGNEGSIDEKVLESLQPHANLECLCLDGYNGSGFPYWMQGMMLPSLVEIELRKCNKCEYLPSLLGKLPLLESLTIDGMDLVKALYVENDDHQLMGDDNAKTIIFPSAKTLCLHDMKNLEDWTSGVEEGRELLIFPRLGYLRITNCPSLRELPQLQTLQTLEMICGNTMVLRSVEKLTSLTLLYISDFKDTVTFPEKLVKSGGSLLDNIQICSMPCLQYLPDCLFDNLTSLTWIEFYDCKALTHMPEGLWNLKHLDSININGCGILSLPMRGLEVDGLEAGLSKSLTRLSIENCPELASLSDGLQYLTSLGSLSISGCPKLTLLPGEWLGNLTNLWYLSLGGFHSMTSIPGGIQHLKSLHHLEISSLKGLFDLPEWLGSLTSLSRLTIFDCDGIQSLPEQLQLLMALETLDIRRCPRLERRCRKGTGEDWYKIARIPNIELSYPGYHRKGFNPFKYNCLLRDLSSSKGCWPQF